MTEERRVSFGYNSELDVRLKNPVIKVQQDFDLSKDTKFSMRTLLLLCVFCVGVFGFGLNPNFFGYDLVTNYRTFIVFCLLVLSGQTFIAVFQYRLNRGKLRRHLQMYDQEIDRLEEGCKSEKSKVFGLKKAWDEALTQQFPLNFQGQRVDNKEKLNNLVKPRYDVLNANYKRAKNTLIRAKREKLDAEMVYKWINGKITFGLVVVAFVLGCCAFRCNCAVVDKIWRTTDSEQYILLNIKNLDQKCLLSSNSVTALLEKDLFQTK